MKHIKGLDTLRAFAVIFVIIDHWPPLIDCASPVLAFSKRYLVPDGQFGVDLFFVLSGFLITSILLTSRMESKKGDRLKVVGSFMVRRALRIFPIYYLLLLFLFLVNYAGLREHIWYYVTYTSNILFFRNETWGAIPHTWSLAVEEQFYIFWPWIILFVNEKYLKYVFAFAIATGVVSGYITTNVLGKGSYPILLYNCMGCFGLGGYYAYARLNDIRRRRFEKALFPVFIISLFVYFHWKAVQGEFWQHTTFLFRMVDGIIALQAIVAIVNNRSEVLRKYLLENKALNFIGRISYGIYLYHYALPAIYNGYLGRLMSRHPGIPRIISDYYFSYGVKLLLLLLLCWLSYEVIEKPFLRLKKRFQYNN